MRSGRFPPSPRQHGYKISTTRETQNDDLDEVALNWSWSPAGHELLISPENFIYSYPRSSSFPLLQERVVDASMPASVSFFFVLWCLTGKEMFFTSWMSRKGGREGLGVAESCWVQVTAKLESDTQMRLCQLCFLAFGSCSKVFLLFGLNKHLPTKWKFASLSDWKHSRHKVLREKKENPWQILIVVFLCGLKYWIGQVDLEMLARLFSLFPSHKFCFLLKTLFLKHFFFLITHCYNENDVPETQKWERVGDARLLFSDTKQKPSWLTGCWVVRTRNQAVQEKKKTVGTANKPIVHKVKNKTAGALGADQN